MHDEQTSKQANKSSREKRFCYQLQSVAYTESSFLALTFVEGRQIKLLSLRFSLFSGGNH